MSTDEVKAWLVERRARVSLALGISIVPLVLTGLGWLAPIVVLLAHRKFVARCLEHGVLVSADILEDTVDGGVKSMTKEFPILRSLLTTLAHVFPIIAIRVKYELEGRPYQRVQFCFSDETVHRDGQGQALVLVDSSHPRLMSYIVTERHISAQHEF
jgi:hypothetical protein